MFEKAIEARHKYLEDLAQVWAEWIEMELRHNQFKRALDLVKKATEEPKRLKRLTPEEERTLPVQQRLYRSLKLWGLYVDLEESLGSVESTRAAYDKIMDLKIATPQIVLNYASFLQENKFWEDSFRVYERAVSLFKYPHSKEIWQSYLKHFVGRYGGTKLERARDLFEQALSQCPPEHSKAIYLEFALLEEKYGLARHAMEVYQRAARNVPKKERLAIYDLYLSKASEFFGVGKLREIYEGAMEAQPPGDLPDADVRILGMRYAMLEKKLGEIDRSRAILVHVAPLCDPKRDKEFWAGEINVWGGGTSQVDPADDCTYFFSLSEWKQFEVAHGNEDTFKEMLRIQRSIAASYSHVQLQSSIDAAKVAAQLAKDPSGGQEGLGGSGVGSKRPRAAADAMALMEEEALAAMEEDEAARAQKAPRTALAGFVSAGVIQQGQTGNGPAGAGGDQEVRAREAAEKVAKALANPEEMEVDLDGDDEEEEDRVEAQEGLGADGGGGAEDGDEGIRLATKAVPAAVFGSLAQAASGSEGGLGALDRFKKKKAEQ